MQSTKLQPSQLINPQGSPGIVLQGEGPQIHAQPSPWATTPMGSDDSGSFCLTVGKKNFDSRNRQFESHATLMCGVSCAN